MKSSKLHDSQDMKLLRDKRFRQLALLFILMALFTATVIIVVMSNPTVTLPVFVFLFIIAVGFSLMVPFRWSILIALVATVAWIGVKRALGVWTEERLVANIIETVGVIGSTLLSGTYHQQITRLWDDLQDSKARLVQLDLEDRSVGLLKRSVGILRLEEEVERAVFHRRPLGLILVMVQPTPGVDWDSDIRQSVIQAIGIQIKDIAQESDISFLLEEDQIALIVTEAVTNTILRLIELLGSQLETTRYMKSNMRLAPIKQVCKVRYGFSVFLGESEHPPELLDAAQTSLSRSVQQNKGAVFQNVFIDWITLGHIPAAVPGVVGLQPEERHAESVSTAATEPEATPDSEFETVTSSVIKTSLRPEPAAYDNEKSWQLMLQTVDNGDNTLMINIKQAMVVGHVDPGTPMQPDVNLSPYGGVEKGIYPQHAVLLPADDGPWLVNLDHTIDTRINGFALPPNLKYRLRPDDIIEFGALKFLVREVSRTPPSFESLEVDSEEAASLIAAES